MTAVSLIVGCNLGAVTGALLFLNGLPAPNAIGIYMVMALSALVISLRFALDRQA